MERDEFMNVDGEAEFDVDIMKELRYVYKYKVGDPHRTRRNIAVDGVCSRLFG